VAAILMTTRSRGTPFFVKTDGALYHNGWIASTTPIKPPWEIAVEANPDVTSAFKWELYDLSKDWTQFNDIKRNL
jgi:hypothetical protein